MFGWLVGWLVVCVCVCERERERERALMGFWLCVCVCVSVSCVRLGLCEWSLLLCVVCVCVSERERERERLIFPSPVFIYFCCGGSGDNRTKQNVSVERDSSVGRKSPAQLGKTVTTRFTGGKP